MNKITTKLITYELLVTSNGFNFDVTINLVNNQPVIQRIWIHPDSKEDYSYINRHLRSIYRKEVEEQVLTYIKSERMVREYI